MAASQLSAVSPVTDSGDWVGGSLGARPDGGFPSPAKSIPRCSHLISVRLSHCSDVVAGMWVKVYVYWSARLRPRPAHRRAGGRGQGPQFLLWRVMAELGSRLERTREARKLSSESWLPVSPAGTVSVPC